MIARNTRTKRKTNTDRGTWSPVALAACMYSFPTPLLPCHPPSCPARRPVGWSRCVGMLKLPHVSGVQDNEQQEPAFLSWNPRRRPHSHRKMKEKLPLPSAVPSFLSPSFPPNSSWAPSPLNSHLLVCSPPFSDRPMLRGTVFAPPFSSALPPKTKTVPWSAPTRRQDVVGAPHMPRTLAS